MEVENHEGNRVEQANESGIGKHEVGDTRLLFHTQFYPHYLLL